MGNVLDTENVYRDFFRKKMKSDYGVNYDDETHKAVVGLKTMERCQYIVEKFQLHIDAKQLSHRIKEMRAEIFSKSKLKPGAEKLVTHLHAFQIPMAVATGTNTEIYEIKTKPFYKLFRLFHHVVNATSDPEVPFGKPDPVIYLVCARRFEKKPDPAECLVFEDSYHGLLAATRAGMQVVLVPELEYAEDETKDAVVVIKSLEDFNPEEFSLPPYSRSQ